jgi:coiled-coil domain-containing protein 130
MRCHLCPNYIIIRTDPEKRDYTIVSGASRKVETYSAEDAETIAFEQKDETADTIEDPLRSLEKNEINVQKARSDAPRMRELVHLKSEAYEDDFASNQLLRQIFRTKKKEFDKERSERFERNIYFPLLEETEEETAQSHNEFHTRRLMLEEQKPITSSNSKSSIESSNTRNHRNTRCVFHLN